MPYKILVVDDEADNRELLKEILERENFEVITASRAEDAFCAAAEARPDAVLSDVVMPRVSGVSLCRRLRGDRRTAALPIILISGLQTQTSAQTEGLEAGADDYLVRPVEGRLLAARLRALLRRSHRQRAQSSLLRSGSLRVDLDARAAQAFGRAIHLTRKEFDLLALLMRRAGRVLGAPFLLEAIWGYDSSVYRDGHTIEVHISSLRQKLGPRLAPKIVTVSGVGYRFDGRIS